LTGCSTDSDFEPFFRVRDGWRGYPGIGCDIAAVEMSDDFARILGIPKQGAFFYCSCEKCGLEVIGLSGYQGADIRLSGYQDCGVRGYHNVGALPQPEENLMLHFHEHTKAWRQTGSFLAAVSQSQGENIG
jgi:hypothetical protein